MSEHDRFAEWDGAYVLGALEPPDRSAFESHLAGCALCQDAVADLMPLPGLLARVDLDVLAAVEEDPPADLEARLMAAVRPRWWRRTSVRVGLALAAAAAVVGAVVVPANLGHHERPDGVQLALQARSASPLTARVVLAPQDWGTRIDMTCRYADRGYGLHSYALYVVDEAGQSQQVSSWRSGPGDVARTTGSTDLALGQITRVELRDTATGAVLLSSSPD